MPLKSGYEAAGVRVVPGASARRGSFLDRGVILMPSYVNIGVRVGAGSMVDTWATVGSCAQIGANVHLSGGVGIGGVLEPPQAAPVVVRKVWEAAERLGYAQVFPNTVGARVIDDHVILIEAGLPTANLIDFVYGPNNRYWHTPQDTPDNVSATTLGMVGEVVTELVYSGG